MNYNSYAEVTLLIITWEKGGSLVKVISTNNFETYLGNSLCAVTLLSVDGLHNESIGVFDTFGGNAG